MEATCSTELLVTLYQTTQFHIQEEIMSILLT